MLLNDRENTDEIKEESKKYIETNDNENIRRAETCGGAKQRHFKHF